MKDRNGSWLTGERDFKFEISDLFQISDLRLGSNPNLASGVSWFISQLFGLFQGGFGSVGVDDQSSLGEPERELNLVTVGVVDDQGRVLHAPSSLSFVKLHPFGVA